MVGKVELIPIAEGNRITVKENEKVIVGRGSSLGCNEKKISRNHADLILKNDHTLWITPTHTNPVFYRPSNGKTIQLPKDIERELKDGDQIGLLPSSFFFRVSFSIDVNNNNGNIDSDSDSLFTWKKEEKLSPIRAASPDPWSPTPGYRRSTSNQDSSVFDFDDDLIIEPIQVPSKRTSFEKKTSTDIEPIRTPNKLTSLEKKTTTDDGEPIRTPSKSMSLEKKMTTDVESIRTPSKSMSFEKNMTTDGEPIRTPSKSMSLEKKTTTDAEPKSNISKSVPRISLSRVSITSSSAEEQDESESMDTDTKSRKLPKWMATKTPSPITKPTTTTPKSSYSRNSSYTAPTSTKRHLSFEGDNNNDDMNESLNLSDVRSPTTPSETKSPGKVLSRIPTTKSFDDNSDDEFDSITSKSPLKKIRSSGKRRPPCQFGASCYRKNPSHRAEQSHPGDSDYADSKSSNDIDMNDDNDIDKPECPFGKSCYRQNPQHKRDFKH